MSGRFLYVGTFQLPDRNAAAQRVLGIGKLLLHIGYSVDYLDLSKDVVCTLLESRHECYGFTVYSLKYPSGGRAWLQHALTPEGVEEVLETRSDWCGVIAYNYPGVALLRLKAICRNRGLKLIADCTEWYENSYTLSPRDWGRNADSFIRMRIAQKYCDGVIAISKFLKEYYSKYTPCLILPPLVDISKPLWNNSRDVDLDGRLQLFYAGEPGAGMKKDRLDVVVQALHECPAEVCFQVVGINEEDYLGIFPAHGEIVRRMKSRGALLFHGRLSHRETVELLKQADFSIFIREKKRMTMAGFPTKYVESTSCGIPVITTNTSDLGDYIFPGVNGYFIDIDNSSKELFEIFSKDLGLLKSLKSNVKREVFHFGRYACLSRWIDEIILNS